MIRQLLAVGKFDSCSTMTLLSLTPLAAAAAAIQAAAKVGRRRFGLYLATRQQWQSSTPRSNVNLSLIANNHATCMYPLMLRCRQYGYRQFTCVTAQHCLHCRHCWKCGHHLDSYTERFFCKCGLIQPCNADLNFFEVMGMETTFDTDLILLHERLRDLQRDLHPDRFSQKSSVIIILIANISALLINSIQYTT